MFGAAHNGADRRGARGVLIIHRIPTFIEPQLASHQEISAFLAEVERRAFKQAMFAVRDEDSALDVVQDAMLKLTEKYAGKPNRARRSRSSSRRWPDCRRVNAKPFCCVTGRNSMWRKPQPQWAALRA